ncbi:hypothetical protein AX16_010660 [Volvariella volvacea WC 439]|nr:hypothetical protein AX16_010660 [Volvariella volvacea WC 439]
MLLNRVALRTYGRMRWMDCSDALRSYSTSQPTAQPPLAFVLDIDGVLIRGPNVLHAAKRALAILEGSNPFQRKIPYLLLTNGGGVSEEDRCSKLTKQLGFKIENSQYLQAHTVLKSVVHKYASQPVLVLGGKNDDCRKVAEGYGFKQVYTTLDVLAWNPSVWPFHHLTEPERHSTKVVDFSRIPISAVFVFHDPRDWALDVQVLLDVIQSGGYIGGPYVEAGRGKPVDLIFCNPDLLWRSDFPNSRIGQGAFIEAFQGVYQALTGSTYPYVQYGKPTKATYDFASQVLTEKFKLMEESGRDPRIYMIGDNPDSDIAGANGAGWPSILVKTGVFDPQQGKPTHQPTYIAEDVEDAVSWAIKRELESTSL